MSAAPSVWMVTWECDADDPKRPGHIVPCASVYIFSTKDRATFFVKQCLVLVIAQQTMAIDDEEVRKQFYTKYLFQFDDEKQAWFLPNDISLETLTEAVDKHDLLTSDSWHVVQVHVDKATSSQQYENGNIYANEADDGDSDDDDDDDEEEAQEATNEKEGEPQAKKRKASA